MNDRPPPRPGEEAERPTAAIVRRTDALVIWQDGTVRDAKMGLAWEPSDPLAVLFRLAATKAGGDGVVSGTLTVSREFFGDLVRWGEAHPDGGVVSGRMSGETSCALKLHLSQGDVEIFFPLVELARFLAATERACPAGSIREKGTVAADLNGYLQAFA